MSTFIKKEDMSIGRLEEKLHILEVDFISKDSDCTSPNDTATKSQ